MPEIHIGTNPLGLGSCGLSWSQAWDPDHQALKCLELTLELTLQAPSCRGARSGITTARHLEGPGGLVPMLILHVYILLLYHNYWQMPWGLKNSSLETLTKACLHWTSQPS
jgi:hypothetical protein